jgi:hypothetical protein
MEKSLENKIQALRQELVEERLVQKYHRVCAEKDADTANAARDAARAAAAHRDIVINAALDILLTGNAAAANAAAGGGAAARAAANATRAAYHDIVIKIRRLDAAIEALDILLTGNAT